MFKWIKKALFKRKVKKKTVAYIKYLIGVDGFVYIDFGWNDNKDRMANESFTELFFKVHSGQLLDNSVDFIKEECLKNGDKEGFTRFLGNLIVFQQENLQPMMESMGINPEEEVDKVVVKPTDIGERVLRGNE